LLRQAGLNTYYWIYYQDVGVADAEYDRDPKATLRRTLYTFSGDAPHSEINRRILEPGKGALDNTLEPEHLPPWLTESDLDYMASELKQTGFRNPLNYYRNIDRNWQLLAPWAGAAIHQPALFIAGKEHFSSANRRQAMARIAGGTYDAVIVSHRSFEFLPVSDALFNKFMDEQVSELEAAILEAKEG